MASTIFWEMGPAARATMDIPDGLVRLSVGLEEAEDLMADFDAALSHAL
jgi:cystathionine beta-lyase/cystathionine gamma-synthase